MVAPLRRVAMQAPGTMLLTADIEKWHYGSGFDPENIPGDHREFAMLVEAAGAEILWMSENPDSADAVFTYDASLMSPAGAVLMSPGKPLRRGEELAHERFYNEQGIKVIGRIQAPGLMEAGDTVWLNERELAVGRGFRTNQQGIDQLSELLIPQGIEVSPFDLPCYQGAEACLHLLSVISPLSERLALIYRPLLPVALYQRLCELGYQLLEAPHDEFEASGGLNLNVLTTAPGKCIGVRGFPKTRKLMEDAGCEFVDFSGDALCIPCEGGPTCLTRPILRSAHD